MQITNANRLPEPLVRAVSRHSHAPRPNSISITGLVQPPQLRALSIKHDAELSEDAADRIWALLGTLLHASLENHAQGLKNFITEEELKTEVLGWEVVGHYDASEMLLDGELLTDYKLTSVWAVKDGIKPEWEQQLNCYAELIRRAGRTVNQLQIVAIGRDWSKAKAKYDTSYPQQQVKVFDVPLWPTFKASFFMEERVAMHQSAAQGVWNDCTDDERWVKDKKWAVMKRGGKKAIRLYDDEAPAVMHAGTDPNLYVQFRPGEQVRCESYCSASTVCPQFQRTKDAALTAGS
jgi:hypothetical protein